MEQLQKGRTVTEIARKMNFSSPNFFCAFFKNGEIYKKVPFANAEEEFIKEIRKLVD